MRSPATLSAAVTTTAADTGARAGLVDIVSTLSSGGEAGATGMVITPTGEILTNNHVINGAVAISVTDVATGLTSPATVLGWDRSADVAVLQMGEGGPVPTVTLGDSNGVRVGEAVTAIGNAGGMGGPPVSAAGTVTGLDQSVTATDRASGSAEALSGLIATSAPIQPGDSGGALVDPTGKVIGMDTAANLDAYRTPGAPAGYAVPIDTARQVAAEVAAGVPAPGVHVGQAALLGVIVGASNPGGAVPVTAVVPHSPAAAAGIAPGDAITSFNGRPVVSGAALTAGIEAARAGQPVAIAWLDPAGHPRQATVTLAAGTPR